MMLFTTKTCPNCRVAVNFLDKAEIAYEVVDAEENAELAKKYGNADDFAFVNGVLGAYVRAKGQESSENTEAENSEEQQESSVSLNIEES